MTSPSGFIAAAAGALVVSVSAAGFLAARRDQPSQPAPAETVAAVQPAPEASPAVTTPAPVTTPVVEPPPPVAAPPVVRKSAAASTPKPQPARPISARPAPKPAPARETARVPARGTARTEPALPPLTPVVETPPPAPTTLPGAGPVTDPAPPLPAPVVDTPPVTDQKPRFEELTVKADSVVGIRIDQALSSASAKVEERVTARVSRDVTVDGRTVLPTGTRLEGTVMLVEPGSKFKGRARLGIRFHTIVLADGQRVPIQTEALYRDSDAAGKSAATKVGAGAAAGAILGAVIGGKRGAIIGAGVGAGGGTAAVMAGDNKEAVLASGTALTMRLTSPVTIMIERDPSIR